LKDLLQKVYKPCALWKNQAVWSQQTELACDAFHELATEVPKFPDALREFTEVTKIIALKVKANKRNEASERLHFFDGDRSHLVVCSEVGR
jgi:hypothetical protein